MADVPGNQARLDKPRVRGQSRLWGWLDRRTGLDRLLHEALDERIPGGARFAYVFGSGLLFILLSQIITGVFLAFYYVPSADHAHTTMAYNIKEVTAGSFIRSLHAYGSSAMVIILILHVAQTFLYGSYKGRRELLWVSGCVLLVLVMAMAFTGYLLPWDQKAYFATTVGTNILGEIPLIGGGVKRLMRGGTEMGTLTLSRFFVFHVFLIPAAIFVLIAMHVHLFRKAGAAGPASEDPFSPKQKTEPFYPRQVLMDLGLALLLIAALGVLAHVAPFDLGPKANPADTQYVPRPEWYYLPVFQWLKYWPGSLAVVGILVIPGLIGVLFVGLPFIDRRRERRPWRRPVAVGSFAVVLLSLGGLGWLSHYNDQRDPGVARQVAKQRKGTEEFMRAPFAFELETSAASLAAAQASAVDPLLVKGKALYGEQSCDSCHGDGGVGTADGAKLIGIAAKLPGDKLAAVLKHPTRAMAEGGMEPVQLMDEEMKALVAYVASLK